ncbi:hypothetical protein DM860_004657 [Cuscuta australis]|uniref:Uncharacterized protein n=1 Tax=Cuscuta australis TaxID=267555 RepID=A0A328EA11_9ASTE|nr:hypothetical protein DM860_004657 [Cuscuta australis]
MEIKGKGKAGRAKKGEEGLKIGVLVEKRLGNSTPSSKWRYGLAQIDGSLLQDPTFPSNSSLSVRKLGSVFWEVQQPHIIVMMNRPKPNFYYSKDKGFHFPSSPGQPADDSRRPAAASKKQHNRRVAENCNTMLFESPAGFCSSSMEIPTYRPAMIPPKMDTKCRSRNSSHSLNTSTELLQVLNRIWSLEEQNASHILLVKSLKRELHHSKTRIKELQQDKKFKDLSEAKSSLFDAKLEVEREKKARAVLENLCDEFAKEIKEYEKEVRILRCQSRKDQIFEEQNDKLVVHISEAWLDERLQMKGIDHSHKETILDRLGSEIEEFLRAKQETKTAPRNEIVEGESSNGRKSHEQEERKRLNPLMKKCQSERLPELPALFSPNKQHGDEIHQVRNSKGAEKTKVLRNGSCRRRSKQWHEQGYFGPFTGAGSSIVVEKWTSEKTGEEISAKLAQSCKENSLKAMLLEARLGAKTQRKRVC